MTVRDDVARLLADLLEAGAIPLVSNGRLTIKAPPGVLTRARREALADCLPELRVVVAARWRAREECVAPRPCRRMSPCAQLLNGRPCLIPATCCLCHGLLPPGRRYCCPACADTNATRLSRPNTEEIPTDEPFAALPAVWRAVCT